MGTHGQVVSCHPLVWLDSQLAMSERGIWDATQIERQRNEHSQAVGDGKNVCEPRVVVIAFVWRGEERNERREGEVRWWKRERTRGREQPGLEIATIRDTNEGNASDTMHVCFQIAGCQCSEGVLSAPVALLPGLPRFRLLRICRTYEDAFVSQAGPKMICSSREDPSVLPAP